MLTPKNKPIVESLLYFGSVLFVLFVLFQIRFSQENRYKKDCLTKHYRYFMDRIPPIKVFLYNLSLPLQKKVMKVQYVDAIPSNLAHTTVFEYIAYKSIIGYPFRVIDPEKADLFFIPIFCALFNGNKDKGDIDKVVIPQLRSFGDYFDRYKGVDHALIQMLFSQSNVPITEEKQKHLGSMITLGDLNFNYSRDKVRESWRNINFPLTSNIPQNKDVSKNLKRPISAFFIGQVDLEEYDKEAAPIRKGMANSMRNIPRSIVIDVKRYDPGHSVYNYNFSRMMSNSEYCCVPHGDGPTTKRLFDTFRTLCIPIVLSDDIRFPLEDLFVDYRQILLQIPAFHPELISPVMSLPTERMEEDMRRNMLKISHLLEQRFDYEVKPGDLMWSWLWVHFFKISTVVASKRRTLLKNAFL